MNLNELKKVFEVKLEELSLNLNSNQLNDKNEIDEIIKDIITTINHVMKTIILKIIIIKDSKFK